MSASGETAAVISHRRASTPSGPDYCAPCSEAAREWVPWEGHLSNATTVVPPSERRLDALAEAGYRLVEVPAAWPHRAVGGNESNQMDLIHGCCAICLVPWPCPSQVTLDEAVLSEAGADIAAWHDRMTALDWGGHSGSSQGAPDGS